MNPEGKPWCARSDPRMNRAVEARLQNPDLSLYECLRIGGFDFAADEATAMDRENVTLTQRKNQLNRRLRSYRKRLSKAKTAMLAQQADAGPSSSCGGEAKTAYEPQQQGLGLAGPGAHSLGLPPHHQGLLAQVQQSLSEQEESKQIQFNELQSSLADVTSSSTVPQQHATTPQLTGHSVTSTGSAASTTGHQSTTTSSQDLALSLLSSWEALSGQTMPSFSSSQPMIQQSSDASSIYSSLPAASANRSGAEGGGVEGIVSQLFSSSNSASAAASTLPHVTNTPVSTGVATNQPSFSLQATSSGQANLAPSDVLSSAVNAANLPAALSDTLIQLALQGQIQLSTSNTSSQPQNPPPQQPQSDPRRELALRLFEQEVQALYQRTMTTAGYGPQETQATSNFYRDFVQAASQREYQRVHQGGNNNMGNGNAGNTASGAGTHNLR